MHENTINFADRVSKGDRGRYLLIRPHGGLADTINQIGISAIYCMKYSRTLLIDTSKSGLRNSFDRYFEIEENNDFYFQFISQGSHNYLNSVKDVVPNEHAGNIFDYETDSSQRGASFYILPSRAVINFDMRKDYSETLLIRERGGSGLEGTRFLLKHIRLSEEVAKIVNQRLRLLPKPYTAVHVRASDICNDLGAMVKQSSFAMKGKDGIICSDNAKIIETFKNRLVGARSIATVSQIEDLDGKPLHLSALKDLHKNNVEMLVDLFALAGAQRIVIGLIDRSRNPLFSSLISGFLRLSVELHLNPPLQNKILRRPPQRKVENFLACYNVRKNFLCWAILNAFKDYSCGKMMLSIWIGKS